MTHISFLTYGTRGDVEPFLALALHFQTLGFDVSLAAPSDFKDWIESLGVDYQPTTRSPIRDIVENPALQDLMNFNLLKVRRGLKSLQNFMHETLVETMPKAIGPTDLIIAHCGLPLAVDIAEKWNVPLAFLSPIPAVATKEFPIVPFTRSLGFLNKWTYLPIRFARLFAPRLYREARAALGLAPVSRFKRSFYKDGAPVPIIHIYSPHLVPRPADWPEHASITGHLFFDKSAQDWQPSSALSAFLKTDAPLVYVGFGSMITGQSADLVDIVLEAAKRSKARVLLSAGWAGLKNEAMSQDVFLLGDVPHHALFPLVAGVVHHGGAGTLAAGLRAGRPTLVCPFGFDQPWWGHIVAKNKLGPPPIHQKNMTHDNFYKAFDALINTPLFAENAHKLGVLMKQEDGVTKTAQTILNLFELS